MGVGAGWYYDSKDGDVVHQNWVESLANVGFSYFHGPYKTEAAALAHKGVTGGAPAAANESIGQQAAKAAATGSWSGALIGFLVAMTDWHLWASLGWLVLGLALILIGIRMWTGRLAPPGVPGVLGAI